MTVRFVALDKLNFAADAKRLKMPLLQAPFLINFTGKFKNSKI